MRQLSRDRPAPQTQAAVSTKWLPQPQKVVAWQSRRLEFEDTPLSQVIADKHVDGAFDADDRESLVAFLKAFEDVVVEKRGSAVVIRSRQ